MEVATPVVLHGDQIVLKSYHNKYLVAENDFDVNANRPQIGVWERWAIQSMASSGTGNCISNSWISAFSKRVILKSHHGKYLHFDNVRRAKANFTNVSMAQKIKSNIYIKKVQPYVAPTPVEPQCLANVVGPAEIDWSQASAKLRARIEWRQMVKANQGDAYKSYYRAQNYSTPCVTTGRFLSRRHSCQARGEPCKN